MTDQPQPCINCGHAGSGQFCSNCGQKLTVQTITWRYVASEIMDRWIGLDTKFGRTVVDMFKYPERVTKTYLSGNSIKYIGPLGYYMVMTALWFLLLEFLNISLQEFIGASNEAMGMPKMKESPEQMAIQEKIMNQISHYFRVFAGLQIPFSALAAKLYYKKNTFLHHLIRLTYIQAHVLWTTILITLVYSIQGTIFVVPMMILSISYICWALMRCYPQKYKVWGFIKGLLVWLTSYIFFFIATAIISVVIGILYAYLTMG